MNQKSESRSRFAEFLGNRLVLAGSGILLLLILSALTAAPRGWTRELFGPRISIRETIWVPAEGFGVRRAHLVRRRMAKAPAVEQQESQGFGGESVRHSPGAVLAAFNRHRASPALTLQELLGKRERPDGRAVEWS